MPSKSSEPLTYWHICLLNHQKTHQTSLLTHWDPGGPPFNPLGPWRPTPWCSGPCRPTPWAPGPCGLIPWTKGLDPLWPWRPTPLPHCALHLEDLYRPIWFRFYNSESILDALDIFSFGLGSLMPLWYCDSSKWPFYWLSMDLPGHCTLQHSLFQLKSFKIVT